MLTHERLLEVLDYNPDTGDLTWKIRRPNGVKPGDIAGSDHGDGYRAVRIFGVNYLAHRVIWFYVHGAWPKEQLDHRFGQRSDNRVSELREATNEQNRQNSRRARADSLTGVPGVYKRARGYSAYITTSGRRKHLGTFDTAELASEFRDLAKAMLHPFSTLHLSPGVA